jgi:hypothetical protein
MVDYATQTMEWSQFPPVNTPRRIYTDASETGWRIVHASNSWGGIWTLSELSQHINCKELMVIWKKINLPHLRGAKPYGLCATAPQL